MKPFRILFLRSRAAAFSLLEMLVSVALLSLLVLLLANMANFAGNAWNASEGASEQRQSGRAIIDGIARDLQTAMLPVSRKSNDSLQFLKNPSGVIENYPDAVFWQAPIAVDASLGDIAEVGYFVRWIQTSKGNPQAVLCRLAVFPIGRDGQADPLYRILSHPENWINSEVLSERAAADAANDYAGLFAENVVGLWMKCLDKSGQDLGNFDSRTGQPASAPAGTLPVAVEIGVVVLDGRSASRVTPAIRDALIALARDTSRAPDAENFLQILLTDEKFATLRAGARAFSTTIPILTAQ